MGKLIAGAAKRCITPCLELIEEIAKENKKYNFDGAYDDIYVRVIYMTDGNKKAVLIVGDLNRFPCQNSFAKSLTERYGIDPECCIFGCTRNHHTPNGTTWEENPPWLRKYQDGFQSVTPAQKKYLDFVLNATEEAVISAIENAKPARMGYTTANSNINAYRDWVTPAGTLDTEALDGHRDTTMVVMRLEDTEGKTIGMFVNYAMRGCMLPIGRRSFRKINSDLPGAISRFVERFDGDRYPVLWACGGGADQDVIVKNDVEYVEVEAEGTLRKAREELPVEAVLMLRKKFASAQGLEIIKAANSIYNYTDAFSCIGAETFRNIPARAAYNELGIKAGDQLPEPMPHPYQNSIALRMRLTSINGLLFAGINGEAYTRIWQKVKELVPSKTLAILDISYGHVGCIPDAIGDGENGYGTRSSYCMCGKSSENAITDGFEELIRKIEDASK